LTFSLGENTAFVLLSGEIINLHDLLMLTLMGHNLTNNSNKYHSSGSPCIAQHNENTAEPDWNLKENETNWWFGVLQNLELIKKMKILNFYPLWRNSKT